MKTLFWIHVSFFSNFPFQRLLAWSFQYMVTPLKISREQASLFSNFRLSLSNLTDS